jgi:alpha-1,2-mannosyltransferase
MNLLPKYAHSPADHAHVNRALLWLLVFAYVPFVFLHGYEAWSQPAVDFPPPYFATKAVFDENRSPYGDDAFAEHAVALGRWVPPFIYPPPSLLVLYPLHFFTYDHAKAFMLVVNHVCMLFAIWFFFRRLFRVEFERAPSQLAGALVLIYILLFDPTVVTMHLGQVNLLLLICVCFTWHALKRNGSALAIAIPLSLAIVIKTYPLVLLPLLVFRGRYKAVVWTLGLFAVYCAASYVLLPQTMWADWLQKVVPAGSEAHPGPWNQNIRAFVARTIMPNTFSQPLLELPGLVKPLIGALTLTVVGTTLWASFLTWRRPDSARTIDIQFSLFLFMMFLIAPVSWEHHFVYLLPSLVLVILLLLSGEVRGQWRWIAALSLCLIAWRFPITDPRLTKGYWTLLISAKFYPAVALWLFFVVETLRLRQVAKVAPVPELERSHVSATA